MQELKAHCITTISYNTCLCYDKDEVDAVLAAKDKEIAELKEERRWRKFSEENPEEKQWVLVFVENPSKYGTYVELRRWDLGCKFDV